MTRETWELIWNISGNVVLSLSVSFVWLRHIWAVKAAGDEVARCLEECADDLEAEVVTRYGGQNPPIETERKRLNRDLLPVHEARAALAAWERAK